MTKCTFSLLVFVFVSLVAPLASVPPISIPEEQIEAFTLRGAVPVIYSYRDDSYAPEQPIVYTSQDIEHNILKAQRKEWLYYGATDHYLYQVLEQFASHINNRSVAIIGSVTSWYESILLAYGAIPTTIEYNTILCEDPRITTMTVDEYDDHPIQFDAIVSISSFEHDGLGRYGDPINPWGDLEAMQKTRSMLKPGGILILAVPIGKDYLVWNLHRIYGKKRLPLLLQGWDVVATSGYSPSDLDQERPMGTHQPIFVLTPSQP